MTVKREREKARACGWTEGGTANGQNTKYNLMKYYAIRGHDFNVVMFTWAYTPETGFTEDVLALFASYVYKFTQLLAVRATVGGSTAVYFDRHKSSPFSIETVECYDECELTAVDVDEGTVIEYIIHEPASFLRYSCLSFLVDEVVSSEVEDREDVIVRMDELSAARELLCRLVTDDHLAEVISPVHDVVLENRNGYPNTDHRGSDHAAVRLDFHASWRMKAPVTRAQFMDGVFRVRSHKFRTQHYELFLGATATTERDGTRVVTLDFDYGS